jgi:hypothetical protein
LLVHLFFSVAKTIMTAASLVQPLYSILARFEGDSPQVVAPTSDKTKDALTWPNGARLDVELTKAASPYVSFSRWSSANVTLCVANKALRESITGSIEQAVEHVERIAVWVHHCAVLGQATPAAPWSAQPKAELFHAVLAPTVAPAQDQMQQLMAWMSQLRTEEKSNKSTAVPVTAMPPREFYELERTSDDPVYAAYKLGRAADGAMSMLSWSLRNAITKKIAWAIPDPHTLAYIVERAPRILEIGAGSGYWARRLHDLGADVTAIDDASDGHCQQVLGAFHPVTKAEGTAWLEAHRGEYDDHALFFCWPRSSVMMARCAGVDDKEVRASEDEDDTSVAATASPPPQIKLDPAWKGKWVFVIGEGGGGCTGALDSYMDAHEDEWEAFSLAIPCWWGIHDSLQAYRRRS